MSVLVTGSTGFVGKHIVKQLLERQYDVIAATRNEEKSNILLKQFNNPHLKCFVTGDASRADSYEEVFKIHGNEIKHVIHCAFPLKMDAKNFEKEILITAKNSMEGLLNCIEKYGKNTFENLVMTSGLLVLIDPSKMGDHSVVFNEDSWNPVTWDSAKNDFLSAISGAKKHAEQLGWEFYNQRKDASNFKFTSIIPSNILGPQVFDEDVHEHLNASNEVINQLIHCTEVGDIVPFANLCVHVDDVARAHILPLMNNSPMIGNRVIVSASNFNTQDILNYLNDDFDVLRGKIPVGKRDDAIEKKSIGATIESSKSLELLNFKLKSLRECIDDTASQVLRHDGKL